MDRYGLTKLMEECGELITACAKKSAFLEGEHPDGKGDLLLRIYDEIADVIAASSWVSSKITPSDLVETFKLYEEKRVLLKIALYTAWHEGRDDREILAKLKSIRAYTDAAVRAMAIARSK